MTGAGAGTGAVVVGAAVTGERLGPEVGESEGNFVGLLEGSDVGSCDGTLVGPAVGGCDWN